MASKLTRSTYFHPALAAHQGKHFTSKEIEALGSRPDLDQEKEIAAWQGLFAELKRLREVGAQPGSAPAQDLGRRWRAEGQKVTKGDAALGQKMRGMAQDALADPATAAQLPFNAQDVEFLNHIMKEMGKDAGTG